MRPSASSRSQQKTSPRKPSTSARPSPARRPAAVPAIAPAGSREHLREQFEALFDLADADPDAGVDVALRQHRHRRRRARRRAGSPASRRASNSRPEARPTKPPAANCRGQLGRQDAGADRAVLQRGGVLVELDQRREIAADRATEPADAAAPPASRSTATPPGTTRSIISRWPKAAPAPAQHLLAQHAAMRVHQGEGGIVADRADIAEVVGDALELGHQRAQPDRARRDGSTPSAASAARANAIA